MKKSEIGDTIMEVYTELWSLLSLYKTTEGFHTKYQGEDARDFVLRKISGIKDRIKSFRDGAYKEIVYRGKLFVLADTTQVNLAEDLIYVIEETEYFVKQCEIPGVVKRWKRLNPKLLYFECAFEIMEECPEQYLQMRRGLTDIWLSCYPDQELITKRKEYFAQIKERYECEDMEYSEDEVFQEELLNTLAMVFAHTFSGYGQGVNVGGSQETEEKGVEFDE